MVECLFQLYETNQAFFGRQSRIREMLVLKFNIKWGNSQRGINNLQILFYESES